MMDVVKLIHNALCDWENVISMEKEEIRLKLESLEDALTDIKVISNMEERKLRLSKQEYETKFPSSTSIPGIGIVTNPSFQELQYFVAPHKNCRVAHQLAMTEVIHDINGVPQLGDPYAFKCRDNNSNHWFIHLQMSATTVCKLSSDVKNHLEHLVKVLQRMMHGARANLKSALCFRYVSYKLVLLVMMMFLLSQLFYGNKVIFVCLLLVITI